MIDRIFAPRIAWIVIAAGLLGTGAVAADDDFIDEVDSIGQTTIEDLFRLFVSDDEDTLLMPLRDDAQYRTIELREGRIFVDGELWSDSALDRAIGSDDAEAVMGFLGRALDRVSIKVEIDDEGNDVSIDIGASEPRGPMRDREEVVRIGGSVHIAVDERVDGDVVAVGGSVQIDGEVEGDVVAVMGSVNLGPRATVYGDVVAVGGSVHKAAGARIHGELVDAGFFGGDTQHDSHSISRAITIGEDDEGAGLGEVILDFVMILVLALLASAAQLIAPRAVERVEAAAIGASWKALLVGLLVEVFFVPVFMVSILVLVISIIGIPVLIIFIPSALLGISMAFLLGWAAVSRIMGRAVRDRLDWSWADGRFRPFFVGAAALMFLTLLADLLASAGGLIAPIALVIGIAGFLVEYAAWTWGLGAVVLTRFGTRDGGGGEGGSFTGVPGSGGVHFAPDDEGLFDAKQSDTAPPSETTAPVETGGGVYAPPEPAAPDAANQAADAPPQLPPAAPEQPKRAEENDHPETRQD